VACLFVPGLRGEFEPDDVARVRTKRFAIYQTSLPTGSPVAKGLAVQPIFRATHRQFERYILAM
jgi:hypothetical protein